MVYALQELRVDKILFLTKPFFVGIGNVVAETPKVIGVVTVGGLEAGDPVFSWKKDGGIEYEDELFTQGIKAQNIDIGGSYRAIASGTGFEKACGNPAEAPARLQRVDGKREGEHVAGGHLFSCVVMRYWERGQFDI